MRKKNQNLRNKKIYILLWQGCVSTYHFTPFLQTKSSGCKGVP